MSPTQHFAAMEKANHLKGEANFEFEFEELDTENNAIIDPDFTQKDRRDMARMGKKQEFRRNFRTISSIAFTSCVMGTWEILLTTSTPALIAGGSAGFFWSMCWAYAGQFFIVLSLAEMSSMAPTAGGQYHWTSEFAPRQYQKVLSYASGWLSALSWQSFVASNCYICAMLLLQLVTLNNHTYKATNWQTTLLIIAFVLLIGSYNTFAAKFLPVVENIFCFFHVALFFPIIITMLVMAPKKSASEVFLHFSNHDTGWPSIGLTVLVGQVSAMFTVLGSDAAAHMAEEIKDAAIVVPRTIFFSFILNIPLAIGVLVTFLFCLGDLNEAIDSGLPYVYAFRHSTGSAAGATGLAALVLMLIAMIAASVFASASRQSFAFARDDGFPGSSWLKKVSPRFRVPVNANILTCTFTTLVSLINIGSPTAFFAVLSLGVVALMATYLVSISCVLSKRIRGQPLPPTQWSLGRWGIPVNAIGITYAIYSFFWSLWPNYNLIGRKDWPTLFNWSSIIFVGVLLIALVNFLVHARKVYDGPVARVRRAEQI